MELLYAGIGSRRTPEYILKYMTRIASKLELLGYKLRSGGAQGCDKAFEAGVRIPENKEIFKSKDSTFEAIKLASEHHPFWERCSTPVRKLHGRNSMILLGENLNNPVKFVICYTKDGKNSGGTGLGMNIADAKSIPVFNLFFPNVRKRIDKFLEIDTPIDLF